MIMVYDNPILEFILKYVIDNTTPSTKGPVKAKRLILEYRPSASRIPPHPWYLPVTFCRGTYLVSNIATCERQPTKPVDELLPNREPCVMVVDCHAVAPLHLPVIPMIEFGYETTRREPDVNPYPLVPIAHYA
jgi:hypothetical protein